MITIDLQSKDLPLFHLQTLNSSYIVCVHESGQLINLHYGARIEHFENIRSLFQNYSTQVGSSTLYTKGENYTLDTMILEYPSYGKGDYRTPALLIEYEDGTRTSDFTYYGYTLHPHMINPKGMPHIRESNGRGSIDTLEIILKEKYADVFLHLFYTAVDDSDAIVRFSRVENKQDLNIQIHSIMSMNLDFTDDAYDMITLDGMWIRERQLNRRALKPGVVSIDSKKGVSGANHAPFIGLVRTGTCDNHGEAYGYSLAYSGNFVGKVEVSPYHMTRIQMGISDFDFEWPLAPEEVFETPEVVMVYASNGLNGMSQRFHNCINNHLIAPQWQFKERPILINNWEATYFDFDEKKLLKLAKAAKDVGIELFVLDDGWFKGRNNDQSSLGDWVVDTKKLPNGLEGISKKIRALGMDFGIWVEPEMVSEDSDLYRTHPEWSIGSPLKETALGRNQRLLNLSDPMVRNYLMTSLTAVIEKSNASYVKWDMNRNFSDMYGSNLSPNEMKAFNHRYVLGLYALLSELTEAFPNVLFESCSSGGNRFDMGMLYYMPQTWTSDNTDATERVEIQYGTSLIFPTSTMGAHVSGRPSHQVLRTTPIESRFNVAAFGLLGYELDLTKISAFDKRVITKQIEFYKKHRRTLQFGTFYRNGSPFEQNITTWYSINDKEVVLGYYQKLQRPCAQLESIKLNGLDDQTTYAFETRMQFQNVSTFGELINPYIPINIKEGGLIQNFINNRYLYAMEQQSFKLPGDVIKHIGLRMYAQFSGTGIDEHTRFIGDFGSRMYVGIGL